MIHLLFQLRWKLGPTVLLLLQQILPLLDLLQRVIPVHGNNHPNWQVRVLLQPTLACRACVCYPPGSTVVVNTLLNSLPYAIQNGNVHIQGHISLTREVGLESHTFHVTDNFCKRLNTEAGALNKKFVVQVDGVNRNTCLMLEGRDWDNLRLDKACSLPVVL
ncbi:hypothetical protein GYMLUDRAFT_64194 [Collybiopsis luxurians FD-317 M1]|uniref:Secreted protein n=1 Tax=Collybiopsis luxurians FD-317 M1 TaxID=944289 RepID=A0A0D0C430_9AGAR|nr:hypothetical protein GYMLUDRAFT_64194 [Collybiopsis luxurians FD-317 M1]